MICYKCGACCYLKVELSPEDTIPDNMTVDVSGVRYLKQKDNGSCIFLTEDNICMIYNFRPKVCRDYFIECYHSPTVLMDCSCP
jgi:Fe-S-cluster containining protein